MRSDGQAVVPPAFDASQDVVVEGSRWYRTRLMVGGPILGIVPPLALGLVSLIVLRVGSGRVSAVVGLLTGVVAAPGMLVIGAPIADEASYPVALILSLVFWVAIGAIATRRAIRRPFACWRDYWWQYSLLAVATAVGALLGLAIAAARIGETLL